MNVPALVIVVVNARNAVDAAAHFPSAILSLVRSASNGLVNYVDSLPPMILKMSMTIHNQMVANGLVRRLSNFSSASPSV